MIKDIAVHLTGSSEDEVRLAHAEAVAATFGAHITGIYVYTLPELIAAVDPVGAGYLQPLIVESGERADAAGDVLRTRFERLVAPHDLRRLDPLIAVARAAAEALPFLQRADQVIVGIVEEQGAAEQFGEAPGADIARYLSRHGVPAEIRPINGWSRAGEALLNEARHTGAEMIVMGGYGHSRFREWILGGATRQILSHAPVPVLTAH
jgi:nucleotide-binding universal stress UspA family protein